MINFLLNFLRDLRDNFLDISYDILEKIAFYLGYPDNPGMPVLIESSKGYFWQTYKFTSDYLKVREVPIPPPPQPKTYFEVLVGNAPQINEIDKVFLETSDDGFFGFFIPDYQNVIFLPDGVSEFLQIQCHICTDLTFLELLRQTIFLMLITYTYLMQFRLSLAWFIAINPYTFPLIYLLALTDFAEDWSYGFVPTFRGISFATPVLMGIIGKATDYINHLVFTMPYLPSEALEVSRPEGDVDKAGFLYFKYFPFLWYKHPIPNEIREHWYTDRPDILKYLQEAYKDLDVQLVPDRILIQQDPSLFHSLQHDPTIVDQILEFFKNFP